MHSLIICTTLAAALLMEQQQQPELPTLPVYLGDFSAGLKVYKQLNSSIRAVARLLEPALWAWRKGAPHFHPIDLQLFVVDEAAAGGEPKAYHYKAFVPAPPLGEVAGKRTYESLLSVEFQCAEHPDAQQRVKRLSSFFSKLADAPFLAAQQVKDALNDIRKRQRKAVQRAAGGGGGGVEQPMVAAAAAGGASAAGVAAEPPELRLARALDVLEGDTGADEVCSAGAGAFGCM
jgi:hypothetical protein